NCRRLQLRIGTGMANQARSGGLAERHTELDSRHRRNHRLIKIFDRLDEVRLADYHVGISGTNDFDCAQFHAAATSRGAFLGVAPFDRVAAMIGEPKAPLKERAELPAYFYRLSARAQRTYLRSDEIDGFDLQVGDDTRVRADALTTALGGGSV